MTEDHPKHPEPLKHPEPSRPGGEEVKAPSMFWNPEPGDTIEGILVGKITIGDEDRWQLRIVAGRERQLHRDLVMPNHRELNDKLQTIEDEHGKNFSVWIGFQGIEPVKGKPQGLARYRVQVYQKEVSNADPSYQR